MQEREVFWVDGGEFAATPLALEEALRPARVSESPLIVIDGFDHISVAGPLLRQTVLPSLADSAVVIIASRRTPERAWFSGGWECVTAELELGGMAGDEARELLRGRGVGGRRAKAIVDWAGGSPLALGVAAAAGPRWSSDELADNPELFRPLIRQVSGNETCNVRPVVLAVAALCPGTTTDLLGAVAPECDAAEAMEQLRSLSFAEKIAGAIVLDDLARKVLSADLRRRAPELEHELRRRIADLNKGGGPGGRASQVERVTDPGSSQPIDEHSCEAVRDALRNFGVPSELANNELASGQGIEERAQSVRGLLSSAVDRAFGDTPNEQLLKRVLTCGYLEPRSSHEQCAWELHLSRAAYFRRLRAASDRLAEYVVTAARPAPHRYLRSRHRIRLSLAPPARRRGPVRRLADDRPTG
jgi:hypothetical protein